MKSANEEMIGKIFGKLKVLAFDKTMNRKRYWKCLCECGSTVSVATALLNNGNMIST